MIKNILKFQRYNTQFGIALLGCIFLCILQPGGILAVEDSSIYFSYFANSSRAGLPFYYAGYAALYPEFVASMTSVLPLWITPFLYSAASLIVGAYFLFELILWLEGDLRSKTLSVSLALIIAATILKLEAYPNCFLNLTYSIWPMFLGFTLRLMRNVRGDESNFLENAFSSLAVLSHPLCLIMIPPLVALIIIQLYRKSITSFWNVAFLALSLFYWFTCVSLDPSMHGNAYTSVEIVINNFSIARDKFLVIGFGLMITSSLFLFVLYLIFREKIDSPANINAALIWYVGGLSFIAFLFSPRYLIYHEVHPRYVIVLAFSNVILAISLLSKVALSKRFVCTNLVAKAAAFPGIRAMIVVSVVAMVFAVSFFNTKATFIGAFRDFVVLEDFMRKAEAFRENCVGGAYVLKIERWAPVVTCKRIEATTETRPLITAIEDKIYVHNEPTPKLSSEISATDSPAIFSPGEKGIIFWVR